MTVLDLLGESKASIAAKKAGLVYASFGRWKNGSGHIVAHTIKGELRYLSPGDIKKHTLAHLKQVTTPKTQPILTSTSTFSSTDWWLPAKTAHNMPLSMLYRGINDAIHNGAKQLGDKVSGPLGTNDGGIYNIIKYGMQEQVYAKFYKSVNQSYTEVFANRLYGAVGNGINQLDTQIYSKDGKICVGTPIIYGAVKYADVPQAEKKIYANKILNNFLVDVLLCNWDTVGLEFDNILCRAGGHGQLPPPGFSKKPQASPTEENTQVWRVDNGGALFYRAQGEPKSKDSLETVTELDTFLDSKKNTYAQIFKDAGYKSLDEFKDRLLSQLLNLRLYKANIQTVTENAWGSSSPIGITALEILNKRYDQIVEQVQTKYGYKAPASMKESDRVAADMVSPKKDPLGLRFKTHPQEKVIIRSALQMEKLKANMAKLNFAEEDKRPWGAGRDQARKMAAGMAPKLYDKFARMLMDWKDGGKLRDPLFKEAVGKIIGNGKIYCPFVVKKIERGMRIPKEDVRKFLSNFEVGKSMSLGTGGYSADDITAQKFQFPGTNHQIAKDASVLLRIRPPKKNPFVAGLLATHVASATFNDDDPDWSDPEHQVGTRPLPHLGENEVIRPTAATAKVISIKKFLGKMNVDSEPTTRIEDTEDELYTQYVIELEDEGYNKELTEGVTEVAKKIFDKYISTPLAALRPKPKPAPKNEGKAADKAKKLGYTSAGWGWWKKGGKVVAKTKGDELVWAKKLPIKAPQAKPVKPIKLPKNPIKTAQVTQLTKKLLARKRSVLKTDKTAKKVSHSTLQKQITGLRNSIEKTLRDRIRDDDMGSWKKGYFDPYMKNNSEKDIKRTLKDFDKGTAWLNFVKVPDEIILLHKQHEEQEDWADRPWSFEIKSAERNKLSKIHDRQTKLQRKWRESLNRNAFNRLEKAQESWQSGYSSARDPERKRHQKIMDTDSRESRHSNCQ